VLPDPVLTALAVELGTGGPSVADIIAPVATVKNDLFKYARWGRERIKDDIRTERAPGVGANEVKFSKTFVDASVKDHALKDKIPDNVRNNDPDPAGLDAHATEVLVSKLKLGNEIRVAALLTTASKTKAAPSTKWDAVSGATIRKDVLAAKEAFRLQSGMLPNVMVVPPSVATVMKNDSAILELLKYTRSNLVEDGAIPRFEGMTFIEPGMIKDSSNPGGAENIADIYNSDEVYYLYVAPNAGNDLRVMTSLRQVRSLATVDQPFTALKYRDPDASAYADWISVSCNQIELTIADELILRQLDVLT